MADDDFNDLLEDLEDPDRLLDPEPVPVKAKPLTREEVTALKQAMPPSRDLDPALARVPRIPPSDLTEVSFEIYDRASLALRVITRAFTKPSLVILAKVVLDALNGVRTPASAPELFEFMNGRSSVQITPVSGRGEFGCGSGNTHDPESAYFLHDLSMCAKTHGPLDIYDPTNPWALDHQPWYSQTMDRNGYFGCWSLTNLTVDDFGSSQLIQQRPR